MTKNRKSLLFITVLTLLLTACMCFAVGCGDGATDNSVAYSVTVTADNEPASGVKVTVKKGGATFETKTTGNDGKVTFKLVPDSYTVALSNLPVGYVLPENAKLDLTADAHDLTVALEKGFGYTVKLVGPDDKPYYNEGTTVGVCTFAGNCLEQVEIGENGTTFLPATASDYHVKMENLPHNVAYECDAEGYYTGKNFSATDTEMTIKLHAVTDVLAQTPMTDEEKETYGIGTTSPAYKLTKTLKPGETAYYSITPTYNSKYGAYTDYEASYLYNGTAFQLGNKGEYFSLPILQAGKTYYFNVSNTTDVNEYEDERDITFECVIVAPTASYHEITGAGTVTVTLDNKDANAVIALTPKTASAYKLTVDGDALADIVYCPSDFGIEYVEHDDDAFVKNATASAKVTEKFAGSQTVYFAVAAKTAPTTLKVKVEKLGDITDSNVVKHTANTLTKFADQGADKELTYVPLDGSAELYYDETNGYYTLGEGGPIVVVRLTTAINDEDRFYAQGALAYLEYAQDEGFFDPYIFDTTSDADLADLTKGNTITDYRVMLRGFGDYELDDDGMPVAPEITEASYYAKYVNKDGVYPLTKELEEYLKLVAENHGFNMPMSAAYGCEWLFACYYYDEYVEPDVIVGEYQFVKYTEHDGTVHQVGDEKEVDFDWEAWEPIMGEVGVDEYKLVINKHGTYTIYQLFGTEGEYDKYDGGTWKNEDGTYTFTKPNGVWNEETEEYEDLVYTVEFDETAGTLKLSGSDSSEWQFTRVAE